MEGGETYEVLVVCFLLSFSLPVCSFGAMGRCVFKVLEFWVTVFSLFDIPTRSYLLPYSSHTRLLLNFYLPTTLVSR